MPKKIILVCNKCVSRNYSFLKNDNFDDKLDIKKYCKTCNSHTLHSRTR